MDSQKPHHRGGPRLFREFSHRSINNDAKAVVQMIRFPGDCAARAQMRMDRS